MTNYRCPHCGKPIGGWEVACPHCGERMTPTVPPPQAIQQRANPTLGGSVTQGFGFSTGCLLFVVVVIVLIYAMAQH